MLRGPSSKSALRHPTFLLLLPYLLLFLLPIVAADDCPRRAPLLPNNVDYVARCPEPDPKRPCFTHLKGNLHNVNLIEGELSIKDGDMIDFTPKDLEKSFKIVYIDAGLSLSYHNIKTQICGEMKVEVVEPKDGWRLYVQDSDRDYKNVDSKGETSNVVCGGHIKIWVGQE